MIETPSFPNTYLSWLTDDGIAILRFFQENEGRSQIMNMPERRDMVVVYFSDDNLDPILLTNCLMTGNMIFTIARSSSFRNQIRQIGFIRCQPTMTFISGKWYIGFREEMYEFRGCAMSENRVYFSVGNLTHVASRLISIENNTHTWHDGQLMFFINCT